MKEKVKKSEAKSYPEVEGERYHWFWVCSLCHGVIAWNVDICPHCKSEVVWHE